MCKKDNEKGYTMVETIMYISLLGIIGVVATGYVNKVFNRYKTGRVTQQIIDLRKAILNYTAADEDYSRLSVEAMMKDHALPLDMRDARHAFGEKIDFGPVGLGTKNSTSDEKFIFYVTFKNIYRPACLEILSQGQFYRDGGDLDTLIVNNKTAWRYERSFYDTSTIQTVYELKPPANTILTIHPTMDQITKACSEKDNNDITWIFS